MISDGDSDRKIFERVRDGALFQSYREAFQAATGLPLVLFFAGDSEWNPCQGEENENPFCQHLNRDDHHCEACMALARQLRYDAVRDTCSVSCFAGFVETAVPVRLGGSTLAFLKTGEVLERKPTARDFAKVRDVLRLEGRSDDEIEELRDAYFASPVVDGERYSGITGLLSTFAIHLSRHVDDLVLASENDEPQAVRKAKQYIAAHLDEAISLGDVANHVAVSEYYFCKIFKRATGLTFTDFVNRQRIAWAKRELLKPDVRVTEVAFNVGYQSLSQFNRSFARIVGESPSDYRRRLRSQAGAESSAA